MELTGAEIIAECLLEQAVQEVFGYPGGAVLNIYDALYLYRDRIHHTMTAHEQGAAHAADGYSRATGKTGVVFATSGPGATNLVTGIASAYMDSSPMVAITGNVSRDLLGRDSFQEVNIKDIVKPVTKASFQVMEMEELAPTIRKAFEIARTGRKGPVLVDVPKDITALKTEYVKTGITYENKTASPDKIQIEAAVRLIQKAKRPMLYAGGGVIGAQAARELTKFAELCDAPVFCSLMGLGGIDARHPLFFGNIGMHGMYESGMATQNADLIIALGGGVVGDITGFAAATFLRGVSLCQIPTTLLAQVDSSVGGKTGVDLPEGKNLVGAFYQPRLVLIDPNVLASLPDSTFADGMAEVVKYGYISNREILTMVSQPDYKSNIENIIYECVKIKRDVVAIDEHDTGLRMILNFGHTIGHAAEKLGNYTDLTHGQAVAIGMVAAMRLSALLGNEDLTAPLIDLLKHIGLPTELNYDREAIFNALLSDKKKFGATVNFILVREAGRAEITPIDAEKLHEDVLKL